MNSEPTAAWFCVRTRLRQEHIAAAHLAQAGLETYLPRIRFRRATRGGPVWFTEPLFPAYLFARFDLSGRLRLVNATRGVQGVVHFGQQWPAVPEQAVFELQRAVPSGEVHVVEEVFVPGDEVKLSGGAFDGLIGLVQRVLPVRERVAVLLEFLGRQTCVELPLGAIVSRAEDPRSRL